MEINSIPTAAVAAAGLWPAVPLTGYAVVTWTVRREALPSSRLTAAALYTVAGLSIWSVPLLGSATFGVYRPTWLGLCGWVITVVAALIIWKRGATRVPRVRKNILEDRFLLPVLVVAGCLYLGFPTESIYGGRDEGVYANHAVYLVHHGRLDVPYPWPADAEGFFAANWNGFPGLYNTASTMTVQFGHLFPVWLAQVYATLGEAGLFRLNAVFALLALAVLSDVFALSAGAPVAFAAALFLAFNPSELWVARITLSEIFAQLFIWSGLCLFLRALQQDEPSLARWAGVCFGMSAVVRFDSLLLFPMLMLAHAAYRVVNEQPSRGRGAWSAIYLTAIPVFALALGYFSVFSRPYLHEKAYLQSLAVATGAAALLLALQPTITPKLRVILRQRVTLTLIAVGLGVVAAYAYWIRPRMVAPPHLLYQWPGFYIDTSKGDYRTDSLVDLSLYLSPVVVWAAVAGFYVRLRDVVRGDAASYHAVLLVIIGGFSVAYLYAPLNQPDHLWWSRRFIPVVIPGFILCAASAADAAVRRLPRPWAAVATAAAALYLIAFTASADQLILTFTEDSGLFSQLQRLAQKLPADVPIIMHAHKNWTAPLYVSFDRRVIPLDINSADGQRAWKAWCAYCVAAHQPIYLASEVEDAQAPLADDITVARVITEPAINRLPQKILSIRRRIRLVRTNNPESIVLPPPQYEHPIEPADRGSLTPR